MSKLSPQSAFDGFRQNWEGLSVTEIDNYELVSLSIAKNMQNEFAEIFKSEFAVTPPAPNQFKTSQNNHILWSSPGQFLILSDHVDILCDEKLSTTFKDTAYTVLQSDGWSALRLQGSSIYDVLERFIPLNLREAPIGFAARTAAHHIAIYVLKTTDHEFILLTPRSSAHSFLEGLTHTIENVNAQEA